jgi:hypothetical protein
MVFSLANYQSQPLLTNIVKYQRHANKYWGFGGRDNYRRLKFRARGW